MARAARRRHRAAWPCAATRIAATRSSPGSAHAEAVGYNVLWGIAPNKLYQTYQVFADRPDTLELRALTVGQGYYFAVEAFNENGVSRPSDVAHAN